MLGSASKTGRNPRKPFRLPQRLSVIVDEIPLETGVESSRAYESRFYRLSAEETALVEPGKEGDQLVTVCPSGEAAWGETRARGTLTYVN